MTLGLNTVNGANAMLGALPGTVYVQLHTADPGAAGTTSVSGTTTRQAMTLAAASGGARAASTQPAWSAWAAGAETISHISLWSAASAGNFIASAAAGAPKLMSNGDILTLSSYSISQGPLAA